MQSLRELGPRVGVKLLLQALVLVAAVFLSGVDIDALAPLRKWSSILGVVGVWAFLEWAFRASYMDDKTKEAIAAANTAKSDANRAEAEAKAAVLAQVDKLAEATARKEAETVARAAEADRLRTAIKENNGEIWLAADGLPEVRWPPT